MINLVLSGLLGYLLGSFPTGVLVSRLLRETDVRERGSGHTGGLNVTRTAGLPAGVLTALVDLFKGAGAVVAANTLSDDPWAVTLAGMMAVVGHDWSIFLRFGGGIGLMTLAGTLLGRSPGAAILTALAILIVWLLMIKLLRIHRARATILVLLLVGPILWLTGSGSWAIQDIWMGVLGGAVAIIKTLPDWNRQYSQEQPPP
jgi:glycerol-3-phosphate acyltransferase PlsY